MNAQFMVIPVFLWAGMILGISFLESWVKFYTPSLSRTIGLDVGQTVFSYFHLTQWIWLLIICTLAILMAASLKAFLIITLLTVILSFQYFFIFPILKKRVFLILKGEKLKNSIIHTLYGALEVLKFLVLISFGVKLFLYQ